MTSAQCFWLALLTALLTACGTASRRSLPQSVTSDGRTVYGTLPLGPSGRERLTALPPVATYRWGLPSSHFSGTTPLEDTAAVRFDMHELRMATTDVLRLNGWREAREGEVVDFEIAAFRINRNAEWVEFERDPRELQPDPRSCQNLPPARRANCVEPMARRYPPVQVLKRGVDSRVALAIMRISDSATAWWISPNRLEIQRATLALLQEGARRGTALDP